jgi:hypothetical protein
VKKTVAASALLAVIFSLVPQSATAKAWYPDYGDVLSQEHMVLELLEAHIIPSSVIEGAWWNSKAEKESFAQPRGNKICTSLGTFPCVVSDRTELHGYLIAPTCSDSPTNCIESVFAEVEGQKVQGTFLGYQNQQVTKGFPSLGFKGVGGTISLWDIPGAIHSGGTSTYAAAAGYNFRAENGRFRPSEFQSVIMPYVEESSQSANDVTFSDGTNQDGKPWVGFSGPPQGCAWSRAGVCGTLYDFNPQIVLGLELKFENYFTNWFKARIERPEISIRSASGGSKLITVSGKPVSIPMFAYAIPAPQLPKDLAKLFETKTFMKIPGRYGLSNSSEFSMQFVDAYRKIIADQAAGVKTAWTFSNVDRGGGDPCLSGGNEVLGIVTTNAMVYQPEPPRFERGFLNYKVSGMHYLPGGEELALGSYDLVMRSSVARCLYNISQAPLSAKVTVVNDRGDRVFATTTVSEKNGWLRLSAKGFTFSNKTIKVKITKARTKR